MIFRFLQYATVLIFLSTFLGTGYLLVTKGGMPVLWQLFWLGFVIWIWGLNILAKLKEKEQQDQNYKPRDAIYLKHKRQLEKLKVATISALVSVTFFYSSISFIFKDNVVISVILLFVTFYGSYTVQSRILMLNDDN